MRIVVVVLLVGLAALAACGNDRGTTSVGTLSPTSTSSTTATSTSQAGADGSTTTVSLPTPTTPTRTPTPTVTRPAVVPTTSSASTTPAQATTTAPLPAPEMIEAREGSGAPCRGGGDRGSWCFFFVYVTEATRGYQHRVRSDAGYESPLLSATGNECGSSSPHHDGTATCHWYLSLDARRDVGQRECVTVTVWQSGRESARSEASCFTWTG